MPAPRSSRPEVALAGGRDARGSARGGPAACDAAAQAVCPATAAQADALLDGELPADAAAALDAHLRACPPCRAHVDALGRLLAAVGRQQALAAPAPASLRARARALAARWHRADEAGRAG